MKKALKSSKRANAKNASSKSLLKFSSPKLSGSQIGREIEERNKKIMQLLELTEKEAQQFSTMRFAIMQKYICQEIPLQSYLQAMQLETEKFKLMRLQGNSPRLGKK